MSNRVTKFVPYLCIIAVWLVLNFTFINGNRSLYCCDNATITIPAKVLLTRIILSGELPLWNPYIFSGMPYLADINLGTFSFFNILYFIFEPLYATSTVFILEQLLFMVGTYLTAKLFKISEISSVCVSLIAGFGGLFTVFADNASLSATTMWMPFIVWSVLRYIQYKNRFTYIVMLILLACQFLSGHPQLTYYTWLFVIIIILIKDPSDILHKLKLIITIFMPLGFLVGVQLIPLIELISNSTRFGRGWDYASFGSLNPLTFFKYLLPAIAGSDINGTKWFDASGLYGYIGVVPLFILLFGILQKHLKSFLIIISVLFLLLAMGHFSPLYWVFYYLVPGTSLFRVPTHYMFISFWSLLLIFGIEIDILFARKDKFVRFITIINIIYIFVSCIFYASYHNPNIVRMVVKNIPYISTKLLHLTNLQFQTLLIDSFKDSLFLVVIFIGIHFVIRLRGISKTTSKVFIGLIIFIEVYAHVQPTINTISNPELLYFKQTLNTQIVLPDADRFRVYQINIPNDSNPNATLFDHMIQRLKSNTPNISILHGIYIPNGYAAFVPKNISNYWKDTLLDPTGVSIDVSKNISLINAGVKYTLIPTNTDTISLIPDFMPYKKVENYQIYMNPKAKSIVYVQNKDGTIMNNIPFKLITNRLSVQTHTDQAAKLVFLQTNYPGWMATIDGKHASIEKFDETFNQIQIPAGDHVIEVMYKPLSFILGCIFSVVGIVMIYYLGMKHK